MELATAVPAQPPPCRQDVPASSMIQFLRAFVAVNGTPLSLLSSLSRQFSLFPLFFSRDLAGLTLPAISFVTFNARSNHGGFLAAWYKQPSRQYGVFVLPPVFQMGVFRPSRIKTSFRLSGFFFSFPLLNRFQFFLRFGFSSAPIAAENHSFTLAKGLSMLPSWCPSPYDEVGSDSPSYHYPFFVLGPSLPASQSKVFPNGPLLHLSPCGKLFAASATRIGFRSESFFFLETTI